MFWIGMLSAALAGPSVVDTYFESVWNQGDVADLGAVVTDDFRGQTMATGQAEAVGPEGLAKWVTGVRGLLPDGRKEVRQVVHRGDQVVVYVRMTATAPQTGSSVVVDQVHWLELQGGRIARDQVFFDLGTVMAQLKGTP